MGRELKRVPMDFNWPLNKIWDGYNNPHHRKCPDCSNGNTVDAEWLHAIVHVLMLAGTVGLTGKFHPWLQDLAMRPDGAPTPRMAELTTGLAGRSPSFIGYDAIDSWHAIDKIIKAAGLPENWGTCKTCNGDAIDPAVKEAYDAWEKETHEVPTGPGYQLWETTSEGSPISPVFGSLDDLCNWAADNATTFGNFKASASEWKSMLEKGFVHHTDGNFVFI